MEYVVVGGFIVLSSVFVGISVLIARENDDPPLISRFIELDEAGSPLLVATLSSPSCKLEAFELVGECAGSLDSGSCQLCPWADSISSCFPFFRSSRVSPHSPVMTSGCPMGDKGAQAFAQALGSQDSALEKLMLRGACVD